MPSGVVFVTRLSFLDDSYIAGVIFHGLTLINHLLWVLQEGVPKYPIMVLIFSLYFLFPFHF
jgi:hypothetical protein